MNRKVQRNNKTPRKRTRKTSYAPVVKPICLQPPSIISQPNRPFHTMSTVTAAAATSVLTVSQLAAHLVGVIATSATTSALVCDAIRITRVCIWGPVATAGTPVQVSLKWVDDPASNTQAGPVKTATGVSSNINEYAYCCLTPPKDSSSIFSQWADASLNTQWLVVVGPIGSIIQFWGNWIFDDVGNLTAGPALSGATTGNIYHKNMVTGGSTIVMANPLNTI